MNDSNWKRTDYETWDDAFRGLAPVIRQQSVRVASYARAIYVQACADGFYKKNAAWKDRMQGQYSDLIYKCGMYHQLGKAMVPPEYQIWRRDFTEEEIAVYRKYTSDGRLLVATLQERGARAKERRTGILEERPTRNVSWLMLREACQQHMERWNGSGYPNGLIGDKISPVGQIVGLAKELDRLSAEYKSEDPFNEAFATLESQSGVLWCPALIDILRRCREQCLEIYEKYIHYTLTVPKTIPLVQRREGRAMGLHYRPMVCDVLGTICAYEAIPWFGGAVGGNGEPESTADVVDLLRRTGIIENVCFYFLYEAADTALRVKNCRLDLDYIVLQVPADFFLQGYPLKRLNQLFADQTISKDTLLLTVPEDLVLNAKKGTLETLALYMRNGCRLLLDGYHPANLSPERLKELGFTDLRIAKELHFDQETANTIFTMRQQGFRFLGDADSAESLTWQLNCGITAVGGAAAGVLVNDDEMIRDLLLREQ